LGQEETREIAVKRYLPIVATLVIITLSIATSAVAGAPMEFQRQGEWVSASTLIGEPLPVVSHLITDVARYNDLLPRFMRSRPVHDRAGRVRLEMRVDLPWPCRDLRATFVQVAAGDGIHHWEYVKGNLDGGSLELSAKPEGNATRLSCLIRVQLPHWCPDWVMGVMARQVLRHVMREVGRRAATEPERLLTATAEVGEELY